MPWYVYLIAYIFTRIIYVQSLSKAAGNFKDETKGTIILQVLAGSFALLFIPFFNWHYSTNINDYFLILLACILYAATDMLTTLVYKHLDPATNDIIAQTSTIFLIFYGLVLFHEKITLFQTLGALLIIGANVLLGYAKRKQTPTSIKWIILALISRFSFATAITIDVEISKHFNLPFYIALTLFIPALLLILAKRYKPASIPTELRAQNLRYIFANSLFWTLMIITGILALQSYKVTIMAPLRATTTLINALIVALIFKQHANWQTKIIASLLVILGMFLLFV